MSSSWFHIVSECLKFSSRMELLLATGNFFHSLLSRVEQNFLRDGRSPESRVGAQFLRVLQLPWGNIAAGDLPTLASKPEGGVPSARVHIRRRAILGRNNACPSHRHILRVCQNM